MDDASKLLENITSSHQQLTTSYCKFSPNPPSVDELIHLIPSSFNPSLLGCEPHEYFCNQPLVEKVFDLIPSLVAYTLPLESVVNVTHVLLITSNPI